jgi:ATP-binding cassette subfamily F protein uup
VITLDKVSLAFGHLPLLDGVSLSIEEGERIAVLGRNGEGKSTY